MEMSTVKNVGSLKWRTNCGKAAGEEVSGLAGIAKARNSTPGLPMWWLLFLFRDVS